MIPNRWYILAYRRRREELIAQAEEKRGVGVTVDQARDRTRMAER